MVGDARWRRFHELMQRGGRFLLTSHLMPDGDSIASEVALGLHLSARGCRVDVVNETAAPARYEFLTRHYPVQSLTEWEDFPPATPPDVAICVDVSSWDYMGTLGEWLRSSGAFVVALDHHVPNGRFGDLDLVHEDAAATTEVVYRYLRAFDQEITPTMAEALHAGILFDTGGLRLRNASNDTILVAAELTRLGANHREICGSLFEIDAWSKIDLLRLALGTLRSELNGRLAWLAIPEDLFRVAGARFVDGDGILDELLSLKDLEVCAMFREMGRYGVKVNLRSKGRHDVGRLAQEFGGGGRANAAGVYLAGSLHGVMDRVLPRLHELLGRPPAVHPRATTGGIGELLPTRRRRRASHARS